MKEHIVSSFNNILPSLMLIGRFFIIALSLYLLGRCIYSLFSTKREPEIWGFCSMVNGTRYDLTHWENLIGRARYADLRINFSSVSRSHAVLCRNENFQWYISSVGKKSPVLVNGKAIESKTEVRAGDILTIGGIELHFFPSTETQEAQQAKRRTKAGVSVSPIRTLILLSIIQLLLYLQFVPSLDIDTFLPISIAFVSICFIEWILFLLYRFWNRTAFEVESLVFLLISIGIAVTSAYSPSLLYKQLLCIVLGIILYLILSVILRYQDIALKLRWPIVAFAIVLLAFNVLLGDRIFGAKNWISFGPISFQPSEFVKIVFVFAGSACLDRLFAKRNIIFTLLFSGYCVGCLALMSDFGTALIFFVSFLCIAFLRTGDLPSVIMMIGAAGFGVYIILHFKPYIADRFTVWRHAWEYTQTTGYQQSRTMSAIASGGLLGVGPEEAWLKYLGAANTDLVFGVVSEEFGFVLSLVAVASLLAIIAFSLISFKNSRSSFYTISASAAGAMLLFQMALNTLGAVDILPLTGVTFPFVSQGGSSMISCWGLLAFLKASDTRQNASLSLRLPDRKLMIALDTAESINSSSKSIKPSVKSEAPASKTNKNSGKKKI